MAGKYYTQNKIAVHLTPTSLILSACFSSFPKPRQRSVNYKKVIKREKKKFVRERKPLFSSLNYMNRYFSQHRDEKMNSGLEFPLQPPPCFSDRSLR